MEEDSILSRNPEKDDFPRPRNHGFFLRCVAAARVGELPWGSVRRKSSRPRLGAVAPLRDVGGQWTRGRIDKDLDLSQNAALMWRWFFFFGPSKDNGLANHTMPKPRLGEDSSRSKKRIKCALNSIAVPANCWAIAFGVAQNMISFVAGRGIKNFCLLRQ
jgi:hypothetical protein